MSELLLGLIIIILCILCEGFFSGLETAMVSLDRAHVKARAERGSKHAMLIHRIMSRPERFFSTTLLGTNTAVVLANAVATLLVIKFLGESREFLTIVFMTPLILLFGEIIPKTVYRFHAERIVSAVIFPFRMLMLALYPFAIVLSGVSHLFIRLCGLQEAELRPHLTREDLENYFSIWAQDGIIRSEERQMIARIFDFSDTRVADIMVPLVNMQAVELRDGIEKALRYVRKHGHSRIPVYKGDAFNIVGILHTFDLLNSQNTGAPIRDLMRPALYAPALSPIDQLLKQMRTTGNSIAVVVNEYGGTIGIITIEDILEEVVGDIYDEHDRESSPLVKLGNNRYLAHANIEIDDLNSQLQLDLPEGDYETLAGFLLQHMKRIPAPGDRYHFGRANFTVKQADERSIKQVAITVVHKE